MIDQLTDAVTQLIFADLTNATGSPHDSGCGFAATNGRLDGGAFSSVGYQFCRRGILVGASVHQALTANNSRQAGQEVEGDARGLPAYFAHAFARNWKVNGIVSYFRTELDYTNRQLCTVRSADNEVETLAAKVWVRSVRVQPSVMGMVDSRLAWNDETLTAHYQSLDNVTIYADLDEPEATNVLGRAGLKVRMNTIAMDFNVRNDDGFDGNSAQSWAPGLSVHLLF